MRRRSSATSRATAGDADGYIYQPDVDPVAQMVNLISTSRNYQAGVEMLTTAKELALAT